MVIDLLIFKLLEPKLRSNLLRRGGLVKSAEIGVWQSGFLDFLLSTMVYNYRAGGRVLVGLTSFAAFSRYNWAELLICNTTGVLDCSFGGLDLISTTGFEWEIFTLEKLWWWSCYWIELLKVDKDWLSGLVYFFAIRTWMVFVYKNLFYALMNFSEHKWTFKRDCFVSVIRAELGVGSALLWPKCPAESCRPIYCVYLDLH